MDDVLIIGGSFAGLSAAMQLGRARRKVTVLDTGLPRNRYAAHAHGLLGHDGKPPHEILATARAELAAYPTVRVIQARAEAAKGDKDDFTVTTTVAGDFAARRLLLSYGIVDLFPDLPGFAESWGRSVLHCPYCHGFEVADRRLGVIYSSPLSLHGMTLLGDWSAQRTLFADGHDISLIERDKLERHGVTIVDPKLAALEHDKGRIRSVRLADGGTVEIDALFAHPRQRPSADLHRALGLATTETPIGVIVNVDGFHETTRPGIFAAGDLAAPMQSAHVAIAAGAMAGVTAHRSLLF